MSNSIFFTFNERYYLSQNPDVQAAVTAGMFASGYGHWQAFGRAEGRQSSPFFDVQVYRDANPDLTEAGLTTKSDFIRHFNTYGFNEARKFMSDSIFDYQYYALQNPDLAAAGITTRYQLQQHFQTYGYLEGRAASPLVGGTAYVNQNADLKAYLQTGAGLNGITDPEKVGIYHFYNFGIFEGRPAVPATPAIKPEFLMSIAVGGDTYINKAESSRFTTITPTVTSSTLDTHSAMVHGTKNNALASELAMWVSGNKSYQFDSRTFDDGILTVDLVDIYGQIKDSTLIKDTVAPALVNLSVTGPNTISVTSSEKGKVGLYDSYTIISLASSLISGTETTIASANTPTTVTLTAQSAVKSANVRLQDAAGNTSDSFTMVVLGTEGADSMVAGPLDTNLMFGFGGNDVIRGSTLADVIYAGAGNDTVTGGAGVDVIDVGTGVDTVAVGTVNTGGIDTVSYFTSDDFIKFAGGLSYWDDTILGDMQSKGTLMEAATYVVGTFDGWALGFVYKGEAYVVIDGAKGSIPFNASTDAIVKLVGTSLGTLSAANFAA